MGVAELRRLRQLEEENRKLKKLVADLALDKHILQEVLQKKGERPARKRSLVQDVRTAYKLNMRRECRLIQIPRGTAYYRSRKKTWDELRMRLILGERDRGDQQEGQQGRQPAKRVAGGAARPRDRR